MARGWCWRGVLSVVAALGLAGCTATIVPPAVPLEPARVAVLDHGRHSSLLLERPGGGMVRYAYGELDWYAKGRTGPARAFSALLLPTEAALGRKRLPGPLTRQTVREQVAEGIEEVIVFDVDARRAEALVHRLDALFEAGKARMAHNPAHDLDFVPIPVSYWLGRNSNLMTAQWLEELGVSVEGANVLSTWQLRRG
jgi:hypothetical protein